MHRSLILAALFSLLSFASRAACPSATSPTCGDPMQTTTSGSVMYASAYGVKADGVTSDDVAMKAATDACAAKGGMLILPPGKILLTGAAQITFQSCHIAGTGAMSSPGNPGGTTFAMTSTTVTPFICGWGARLSGVMLWWPNQIDGVTFFPPFMTDGPTICGHITIDNVVVVNAYDWIKQGGNGYGDWKFSNITAWAVHDLLSLNNTGDSFAIVNIRLTPGPWLNICEGQPCNSTVKAALDAASLNNSFLHVTNGPAVTLSVYGLNAEAWRYAILVDASGGLSGSVFDGAWDGIGTFIDTSSGGLYAGNQFRGSGTICSHAIFNGGPDTGNTPCFNMGPNSSLVLNGWHSEAPRGDFIRANRGTVTVRNSQAFNVGSRNDGTDYCVLNMLAPAIVTLANNDFAGTNGSTHSHGVCANVSVPLTMIVTDNSFTFFNESILTQTASNSPTRILGNSSSVTLAPTSVVITGTNQVMYANNVFDKPPLATVSACGTGPVSRGGVRGYFTTGTGGTTSCSLTLPWTPFGLGGGSCIFQASGNPLLSLSAGPSGTPPTWAITFSTAFGGANVFYDCGGQQ